MRKAYCLFLQNCLFNLHKTHYEWKVIWKTAFALFYRFRRSTQQSKIMVFVVIHLSNAAIALSNNKSVLIEPMVEQKLTYIGKPLLSSFSEYVEYIKVHLVSVEVNSTLIAFSVMRLFIETIKNTLVPKYLFGCLTFVNAKTL